MERIGRPPGLSGRDLLGVARELFLVRGFERTSMDEVAREARISKASLYREHPTKAALYAAVVADWAEQGRDAMRPTRERLLAASDLRRGLVAFAEALRAAVTSDPVVRMRRLVIAEAETHPEVAARYAADSWDRNIDLLADTLREMASRESLDIDDARAAAEQLTWLVVGAATNSRLLGVAPRGTSVDEAVDMFLARYGA